MTSYFLGSPGLGPSQGARVECIQRPQVEKMKFNLRTCSVKITEGSPLGDLGSIWVVFLALDAVNNVLF